MYSLTIIGKKIEIERILRIYQIFANHIGFEFTFASLARGAKYLIGVIM